MLSPELIKKIKKVHIKSGRLVNTMMAGHYRSVFRGMGIEFEEVRDYTPGDDIKHIDWMVSARMGRPYVKRYREERERVVMLLLDVSASGCFGTTENLKKETAAEIAAVIAFNAIRNNDKVGAVLFTDQVEKYIPPKKGSAHVWRVIREFFAFEPERNGTDVGTTLAYLGRVCRKKTVSFLISDFLSPDFLHQLRIASKKHELIAIVLSDPGEFLLPPGGILTARDLETGEDILLDASDGKTRRGYETLMRKAYRERLALFKKADVDAIEISTDGSAVDALTRYFRYREKRTRS